MITIIIAMVLHFSALWDTADSVTVSWYQTARTCLYYKSPTQAPTLLTCFDRPNVSIVYPIGGSGSLDAAYRPTTGGMYTLVTNSGEQYTTNIVARKQYLPVVR